MILVAGRLVHAMTSQACAHAVPLDRACAGCTGASYDVERERTAATILAALIVTPAHLRSVDGGTDVERAVALTDALRAALAKGGGE